MGKLPKLACGLLLASLLLCLSLSFGYWRRPDAAAAITIVPPWLWAIPGTILTMIAWGRTRRAAVVGVAGLWLVYLAVFAEEPRSLARSARHMASATEVTVRVISLNCDGSKDAAAEVESYRPDVVLLQESPPKSNVELLAGRLFGASAAVICGPDASLIARGPIRSKAAPPGLHAALARIRLTTDCDAEVVSVRLAPHPSWADFWSPSVWADIRATRELHREQMRMLLQNLGPPPLVIGGDFNSPADDAPLRLLSPRLRDAFREAGRGWGDTFPNACPIWRLDQIWVSGRVQAATVRAVRSRYSDHRLVICDLTLPARRQP